MSKQIIATPGAPAAIGTYSQAVKAGNTSFILSGQIGLDPASMQLVEGLKPRPCGFSRTSRPLPKRPAARWPTPSS